MGKFNWVSALQKSILLFISLTLFACDDDTDEVVSSELVLTSNIYATIDVYSDADSEAYCSVQLTVDEPPNDEKPGDEYVKLLAGDQLWMTTEESIDNVDLGSDLFAGLKELSTTQELFESESRGYTVFPFFFFWSILKETQVFYNANMDGVESGATYTISLLRKYKKDAKSSVVTMPYAFDLLAPSPQDSFSRSADSIQIEWMPLEDNVAVEASFNTSCPGLGESSHTLEVVADDGLLLVDASELESDDISGDCNTTLTLVKRRTGQLDSAYTGGHISANQVRTVSFITTD